MKYRKLGNSGLVVSSLCLGTMQFGRHMNLGNLGQKETTAMIHHALDKGINFIDTADVYNMGESETYIGNTIKGGIRDSIVLATKARLPMSSNVLRSGATRRNLITGVESSLKRLQTDYIDLFQMHSWDYLTPIEETVMTLDSLIRQGKVRYIGFSNYLAWQACTALATQEKLNLHKYISAQMYYSLLGRGIENEFQSFAKYYSIGVLVWSPLAGGFLSGKYQQNSGAPHNTRFREAGNFIPFDRTKAFKIMDTIQDIAQVHDSSPVTVSLAWLLAKPNISSVIIAARTIEHLDQNIAAIDLNLATEEMKVLDDVSSYDLPYPTWMDYQHNLAEDTRTKLIHENYNAEENVWKDLRKRTWEKGNS